MTLLPIMCFSWLTEQHRIVFSYVSLFSETALGIELKAQNNENQEYSNAVHTFNFCSFKYACNPLWWIPGLWYFFGYAQQTLDSVRILKDMSKNVSLIKFAASS